MFKQIRKPVGLNKEDTKLMTFGISIGVVVWCIIAVVWTGAACGIIYFIFWCLKHFNIVG